MAQAVSRPTSAHCFTPMNLARSIQPKVLPAAALLAHLRSLILTIVCCGSLFAAEFRRDPLALPDAAKVSVSLADSPGLPRPNPRG